MDAGEEQTRLAAATHPPCSPKLKHVSGRPSLVNMRVVSKQPNVTKKLPSFEDRRDSDHRNSEAETSLTLSLSHLANDDDVFNNDDSEKENDDAIEETGTGNNIARPKTMPSIIRRLSSIHSHLKIHIRVQNFLLKYILFFFNFLSWIAGLVSMGVGLWNMMDDGGLITDAVDFILDPSLVILVLGIITFIVAFPGCLGAVRENMILLKVFHISLSLVLIIEIISGILISVFYVNPQAREKLRYAPEQVLRQAIIRYRDDDYYKNWMDDIQKQFKCCGVSHTDEGYKDWQLNIYFNCSKSNPSIERCAVPFSCCIFHQGERMNKMCGFDKTNKDVHEVQGRIYTQGCVKGFGEWLGKHEQIILLAAGTVVTMQLLGVIFARIFVKRVAKQRKRWQQFRNRRENQDT